MKLSKVMLAAALVMGWAAAAPAREAAPASQRATRVKALLIGLTNDPHIGAAVAEDLRLVERYVRGLPDFDPDADLTVLTGDDVTADNILATVDGLEVGPTETLFCYYGGHGAYDDDMADDDPSGGHHFQIPGGDLLRADLVNALKNKGAQLTVLLTDTCNVCRTFQPDRPEARCEATEDDDDSVASTSFAALLTNFEGVVDVNGSSRDQFGWSSDDGSWSTLGLLQALRDSDEALDSTDPAAAGVEWGSFLDAASDAVSAIFQERKERILSGPEPPDDARQKTRQQLADQEDLRPQAFQLDVNRVGAPAEDRDDDGPN
jgi:hypothetical protein